MTQRKLDDEARKQIRAEFRKAVNMPPAMLRRWLERDASRSVGMTGAGRKVTTASDGEAVGHAMGRRILDLKSKRQTQFTEDDYAAMKKVVGYVHRHLTQRPAGDVRDTRWRHSLMNWGHDPLRE